MAPPNRVRLGLWLANARASHHERALAQWAHSQADVELFVLHPSNPTVPPVGAAPAPLFTGMVMLEAARLRRHPRYRAHLHSFEMSELPGTPIACTGTTFEAEALRAAELDLVVCPGTELPPAGVAGSARLGVLAFGWADPTRRDGLPIGFWEVYERRDTTGFSIVRFDGREERANKLFGGSVPTRHYHLLNQAALWDKAHYYLRSVLAGWLATGRLPEPMPSFPNSRRGHGMPSNMHTLAYLGRGVSVAISKKVAQLCGREEHWKVSFLRRAWRQASMSSAHAIDNPPGRYLADPFVIGRDGRDYCFVEDFDCVAQRGAISVYELGAIDAKRLGIAIDEPFHMSFPFLFELDGALFMCPESSAHRDIRIYRCVDFPLEWQLEKIAMTDVIAVDTMLFQRENRWWMLTNMDPAQTGEVCSELYLFSADSPFADDWTPHVGNPIVFDAAYARNGGLLTDGCDIFRVSQRQGFDRYGKGSQINQIMTLTDASYEERCIGKIEPAFGPGLLGTHHLHSCNNMTVFDSLSRARARP